MGDKVKDTTLLNKIVDLIGNGIISNKLTILPSARKLNIMDLKKYSVSELELIISIFQSEVMGTKVKNISDLASNNIDLDTKIIFNRVKYIIDEN